MEKNYFSTEKSILILFYIFIVALLALFICLLLGIVSGNIDKKSFFILFFLNFICLIIILFGTYYIWIFEFTYCEGDEKTIQMVSPIKKYCKRIIINDNNFYRKIKIRGWGAYGQAGLIDVYIIGNSSEYVKSVKEDMWIFSIYHKYPTIFLMPANNISNNYLNKLINDGANLNEL